MLSELCKRNHCHCLCQHETHISSDYTKPNIAGMTLVTESPHNKYRSAVFVRKDLKVNIIQGTVEVVAVEMPDVAVHSVTNLQPNRSYYLH